MFKNKSVCGVTLSIHLVLHNFIDITFITNNNDTQEPPLYYFVIFWLYTRLFSTKYGILIYIL